MNDRKTEEKSKEYAKSQFRDIYANFSRTDISEGYRKGYTQAITDQSDILTQYKALEENRKLRNEIKELKEQLLKDE